MSPLADVAACLDDTLEAAQEAITDARNAAFEAAARACDERACCAARDPRSDPVSDVIKAGESRACAKTIRALKEIPF